MSVKRFNDINLVPLIDVLLVLLVVILLTTSFVVHQVLNVQLPVASQGQPAEVKEQITLVLDKEGNLYWYQEKIDLAEMSARLSAQPNDVNIDIRVDANCGFSFAVGVIDRLTALKMTKFALHTQSTQSP